MPPDSSDGNFSQHAGVEPDHFELGDASSSSSRCDSSRYSRIGNCRFSRTVSEENSAPCWNSTPQRRSIACRSASVAAAEIDAEHLDGAGALRQQADDGAHQHRLAGAGAADEAEDLAAIDVEIDMVEHDVVAEADHHVAHLDHHLFAAVAASPSLTSRSRRRRWRTGRRARSPGRSTSPPRRWSAGRAIPRCP